MGPQIRTYFFVAGPNWNPIAVTRVPNARCRDWGTQFGTHLFFFFVQLRTKSFVWECGVCGVGWARRFGGVTADVNCDEFQVIWVPNWVPPEKNVSRLGPSKNNWVPMSSVAGSNHHEVTVRGV